MTARDHRSEIVLLVALVVLTALGLGVGALVTQGDDTAAPTAPASSPAAAASSAPSPSPSGEPSPEVGSAAFVYACRLLPREDVERIFGAFGAEGRARQTYLSRLPARGEPVAPATRSASGITTSCDYTLGDAAGHTLELDVSQFTSERALARRWAAVRSDGTRVKGTDDQMVSLPGKRSFVMRTGPVLVEVRYSTFGDLARERPMSDRERAWQERRMRAVQRTAAEHLADGSATAGPASATAGVGLAGATTPYLSPCVLLTDDVVAAAGGPRPGPTDVQSSYLPRDQYTDVPVATCERRGTVRGVTTFAVLEVRVAASPAQAEEAEAKHVDNRYPRRAHVREVRTSNGTAYVADLGGFPEWPWRSRSIQTVVGPYELHLSVLTGVTPKRPYGQWVRVPALVAAADQLIADLESTGVTAVP